MKLQPSPKRAFNYKPKLVDRKKMSEKERDELNMSEIFQFYARQHVKNNLKFEEMEETKHSVNMGEFNCFCRDFEVKLKKEKILDSYKKCAELNKPLNFKQFQNCLTKLGEEYAKAKKIECKHMLKELNEVLEHCKVAMEYPNEFKDKEYEEKVTKFLKEKADRYVRYAEMALRKKCLLTDSPAPYRPVVKEKREGKTRAIEPSVKIESDEKKMMDKWREEEPANQEKKK